MTPRQLDAVIARALAIGLVIVLVLAGVYTVSTQQTAHTQRMCELDASYCEAP